MAVSHHLLTICPENEPLWVRLYVHPVDNQWTAMIVADGATPPEPGSLTGTAFFGETQEEAEKQARGYLGASEPIN